MQHSGLAGTFVALLLTRGLVGVGEAAYGPVAPTVIADYYPVKVRGPVVAWFYMAIPTGSARCAKAGATMLRRSSMGRSRRTSTLRGPGR